MFGILKWFESSESIEATQKLDDAVSAHQVQFNVMLMAVYKAEKLKETAKDAADELLRVAEKTAKVLKEKAILEAEHIKEIDELRAHIAGIKNT